MFFFGTSSRGRLDWSVLIHNALLPFDDTRSVSYSHLHVVVGVRGSLRPSHRYHTMLVFSFYDLKSLQRKDRFQSALLSSSSNPYSRCVHPSAIDNLFYSIHKQGFSAYNTEASEPAEARLGLSGQPYRDLFPISVTRSLTV